MEAARRPVSADGELGRAGTGQAFEQCVGAASLIGVGARQDRVDQRPDLAPVIVVDASLGRVRRQPDVLRREHDIDHRFTDIEDDG